MEKNILNEIVRIKEVMGILSEASVTGDIVDNIVKKIIKTSSSDVFKQIPPTYFDDILPIIKSNPAIPSKNFKNISTGNLLKQNFDMLDKKAQKQIITLLLKKNIPKMDEIFIDSVSDIVSSSVDEIATIAKNSDTEIDFLEFFKQLLTSLDNTGLDNTALQILSRFYKKTKGIPQELPSSATKIFKVETWNELITLTDEQIKQLLKLGIWDNIALKVENLFIPTKERLKSIQQLAYNIRTTTDTDLSTELTAKLKKELE